MNLIETGHHEVNTNGDPNLGSYGVITGSIEGLDSEILLDPFEEEFDLPTTLINGSDGQGGQREIIREESQTLVRFGIEKGNAAKAVGVIPFALLGVQDYNLIASEAGGFINNAGITHGESGIGFAAYNEESVSLMDTKKTTEIQVSAIKNVDTSSFKYHAIQEVDIMHRPIGNADEHRDRAGKVDLSVQLDSRFCASKRGPREYCKTKIYGRSIYSVNHFFDVQPVRVITVQMARFPDQDLPDRFIDSPIPEFICVGEIGSGDFTSNAHCKEMLTVAQTSLDITQSFAERNLCEAHRKELITGTHATAPPRHRVAFGAALKLFAVECIHNLGEDQASFVHEASLNKPLPKASPSFKCVTSDFLR